MGQLMLTSFDLPKYARISDSRYGRMPPIDISAFDGRFLPPFYAFVLADKVTMDIRSYGSLLDHRRDPAYGFMAETMQALNSEGLLELIEYGAILERHADVLESMLEYDVVYGSGWQECMMEAGWLWDRFRQVLDNGAVDKAVRSAVEQNSALAVSYGTPHRATSWETQVTGYINQIVPTLNYVNANMVLSAATGHPFYDWSDFRPFYRRKFRATGIHDAPLAAEIDASRDLFTLAFPEFAVQSPSALIGLLQHKHVAELRARLDAAVRHAETLDLEFANRTLREVLTGERQSGRTRKIVGYLSAPIGFLPGVGNAAQLVGQEVADALITRNMKKDFRWFYMLADLAAKESHG